MLATVFRGRHAGGQARRTAAEAADGAEGADASTPEALRQAVEAVLSVAQADAAALREAVNWGDLHCVEVQRTETGWAVLVSEVSPEATRFQAYLQRKLVERGWADVEVRTEW